MAVRLPKVAHFAAFNTRLVAQLLIRLDVFAGAP